jgi:AcrR family transcriptional regulator
MASLPEHLQPLPAGRQPLPREVMEAHQRERVLDAAVGVFAKRGYQATTVDHIVAAARIGVGSFYSLFDGKEDCFLQAFDRIVADGREEIVAALPADASWPEQVVAVLRALLELISSRHLQARLALVEVQTAGPAAMARYEATLDSIVPHLARGRELSPIAEELPATLETATIGGLLWLLQQRILTAEFEPSEQLLCELVEIVAGPYLGEAETNKLLTTV